MRSAIVGCGSIAQVHAQAIGKLCQEGLVAVADIERDKAERMAVLYGAKAYSDWEIMLEREQIDVLHICTPHYLHTPMAVSALERGVHVFMEKPPVINRQQWVQLSEAVRNRQNGSKVGICFQNRYNSSVQYVKKHLDKGTWGGLLGARGIVTWQRDEEYYAAGGWRGRTETEGGGALINQAIHTLDLLQYFAGEKALAVEAVMDRQHLPESIGVEDMAAVYIAYPHARVCLYASNSYVADVPPILDLECEKAKIRIEDESVTVYPAEGGRQEVELQVQKCLGKRYWGAGHFSAIQDFYRCAALGEHFPIEPEDVEDTVDLLLKAYASADSKRKR